MKTKILSLVYVSIFLVCTFSMQTLNAQEGLPLRMQGIDQKTNQSIVSRGSGGISIGIKNDASIMFINPSALNSITGLQISIGGMYQNVYTTQRQQYGTLQDHQQLLFLLESMTDQIPDPDTAKLNRLTNPTQADSVQRPFDKIGRDWNHTKKSNLPLQVFIAAPFSIGKIKMVAGLGAVEYANLNWYYQNNNVLSPNVLDITGGTIRISTLPLNDSVSRSTGMKPLPVQWYQYSQYRSGSINGYGGALSAEILPRLTLGISGLLLKGSTTDREERIGRGNINIYSRSVRIIKQSVINYQKTGSSDYDGMEFTLSGKYSAKYVSLGFTISPPSTITRNYKTNITFDSVAAVKRHEARVDSIVIASKYSISGSDKIKLPWRGLFGLAIQVKEYFSLGFEYEIRSFASSIYTNPNGVESNPWLSSSVLRIGAEYTPNKWLTIRGGVRQNAEVFQPVTSAIRGENIRYPVYSLGCGVTFAGASLNIVYEYSAMKYIDTWSNSASINNKFTNNILASISYVLPFGKK